MTFPLLTTLTLAISRSSVWQRFSFHCHKWESSKICMAWNFYRWNLEKELNIIMHGLTLPKNRMQGLPGMGAWRMSCSIWWCFADDWFYFLILFLFYCCWFWLGFFGLGSGLGFFWQDNSLFEGLCCHFSLPAPHHLGEETDNCTHQLLRLISSELCSS